MPIGRKASPFCGNFNGDGYQISNVNLSKSHISVSNGLKYERRGLFGHTLNCTISNLYVSGVSANIHSTATDSDIYYVGAIVGYAQADYKSVIENCYIQNVSLQYNTSVDNVIHMGGIVGSVDLAQNANMSFSHVSADVKMNIASSAGNRLGGIVGCINLKGIADFTNICSYLQMTQTSKGVYNASSLIGAIITENGSLNLSSCYLSLKTNKSEFNATSSSGYKNRTKGCLGEVYGQFKGKSKFTNVFATVSVFNSDYSSQLELYPYALEYHDALTVNNCKVVSVLPNTCGFSKSAWDLSNMSHPKLKDIIG